MRRYLILLACLVFPFFLTAQQSVNIIPKPVSIQVKDGNFIIDGNTSIKFNPAQKELHAAVSFFSSYIKNISGYNLPLNLKKDKSIELKIAKTSNIGDEGYQLDVSPLVITITGNTKGGIVYGMQSLFQTLPQVRTNAALQVPCMSITDYPRFKWRGLHLDVSRHFFSPDIIKEYINLMASYKLNTFHWHLVDDQGLRIEIKKYPNLTSVAAWRVDQLDKGWSQRPQAQQGEPATSIIPRHKLEILFIMQRKEILFLYSSQI